LAKFIENDFIEIQNTLNSYSEKKISKFMMGIDKNDFFKSLNSMIEKMKISNISENEFIYLFNFFDYKKIDNLKYQIGEMKYSLIDDLFLEENTVQILQNLSDNLIGLKHVDKECMDNFLNGKRVNLADYQKHISIENAIMGDYNKLKSFIK